MRRPTYKKAFKCLICQKEDGGGVVLLPRSFRAPQEINESERVRYTGAFRYLYTGVFRTEVFVYVVPFIFIFLNVFYLKNIKLIFFDVF